MRDLNDLTRPTIPSRAIQERMAAETEERRTSAGPAEALADDAGAPADLRAALGEVVDELAPQIIDLSHDIHDHPETGYEEHHAVATVAALLRRHGIEPEVGVYGMDTALRAEISGTTGTDTAAGGSDEAPGTIAILAEYDALPGRVVLQTTPAEENSTAKEVLAVRGMLDGVDAAIQTHSYAYDVTHQTWLGVRRMDVVFHGVPAHAASQPFMGRNALDAATLALTGIGLLRQQMLPMDRLHAIITDGGQVANIIPERARLSIMVRSKYLETLKEIAERVEEVIHGAALMTGTGVEILTSEDSNEVPVRDNGPLLTSWVRSQRERGRDPLPAGVLPETIAAGTDFGNVSQRVPGIHPLIKVTDRPDVALHTRAMTEAAGASTGDAAALDGAYGLAAVALDWLHDAELRRSVRADFEATGGVIDVAGFWEE